MVSDQKEGPVVKAQLGLWDVVSIMVGIIIGATIYETPPGIFQKVSGPWMALGVWALCGLLSLCGALCYAELGSTYPRSGGDYVYLGRAYGSAIGFLFGWGQLAVIQTGSIGLLAYIYADYAVKFLSLEPNLAVIFAAGAIALLSLMNMLGIVLGKGTQNLLTGVKVIGLAAIIVAGFCWPHSDENKVLEGKVLSFGENQLSITVGEDQGKQTFAVASDTKITVDGSGEDREHRKYELKDLKEGVPVKVISSNADPASALQVRAKVASAYDSLMIAMVLVFLAYGGWNDAAYVASEVRNQRRNIPLALLLGTALVVVIYLLVNAAYVRGLGFEHAEDAKEIASDLMKERFGDLGGRAMAVLVMISALGGVNGMILTGSRVYSTLGEDHRLFALLAQRHPRLGSPLWSLLMQAIISLTMVVVVSTEAGQAGINTFLGWFGFQKLNLTGQGGFYSLLRCTAPVFWLFFLLTAVSLFVLRIKDRGIKRPFTVPGFPVVPLIFCATRYMLYSGIQYAGTLGLIGAALLLAGLPFYWYSKWWGGLRKESDAKSVSSVTPD